MNRGDAAQAPRTQQSLSVSAPETARDFSAVAGQLSLLTSETIQELVHEAAQRHISPSQLAFQKGLLSAIQVDIVDTLLRPDEVIPGYEVLNVIGHGGMGVVYRARQKNLDRVVALKTVLVSQMADSGSLARFQQEALAVGRLRHPNVVAAYDFGQHEGRLYFAMELVEGEDLEELIRRNGALPEVTAWVLARQAAAGLAHAYQQGIVHRDIKPANLLLVPPPEGYPLPPGVPMVKIADFGLAFLANEAETRTRLTAADRTVGTPHYLAPESLVGNTVDQRADIYSLGATVFHMVAGRPPFAGLGLTQILTHKVNQESPSLAESVPGATAATVALVAEMMVRDVAARPADYAQLMRRIDDLLPRVADVQASRQAATLEMPTMAAAETLDNIAATRTVPMTDETVAGRPSRRAQLWLGAAALALLLAAAAAWQFLGNRPAAIPNPDSVPSGVSAFMFDGQSIGDWTPRGGEWSMVESKEWGNVISGAQGVFRRAMPRFVSGANTASDIDFGKRRVLAAFVLHEADAVEFHFGFQSRSSDLGALDQAARTVLRITLDGAALGQRSGDHGQFVPFQPALKIAIDPHERHEVQIDCQRGYWFAWLTKPRQLIGAVPVSEPNTSPEFRLLAEGSGGSAYFGDILCEELVGPPQ